MGGVGVWWVKRMFGGHVRGRGGGWWGGGGKREIHILLYNIYYYYYWGGYNIWTKTYFDIFHYVAKERWFVGTTIHPAGPRGAGRGGGVATHRISLLRSASNR